MPRQTRGAPGQTRQWQKAKAPLARRRRERAAVSDGLHGRSVTNDSFYEGLRSDHPDAKADRDYRRTASQVYKRDQAAAVRGWADKINAQADAPETMRDLANSVGPAGEGAAAARRGRFHGT